MKKLNKLLFMLLVTVFAITSFTVSVSAGSGLEFHGKYPVPRASNGVGYFTYDKGNLK